MPADSIPDRRPSRSSSRNPYIRHSRAPTSVSSAPQHSSFPRKRESSVVWAVAKWIPAFAGMTIFGWSSVRAHVVIPRSPTLRHSHDPRFVVPQPSHFVISAPHTSPFPRPHTLRHSRAPHFATPATPHTSSFPRKRESSVFGTNATGSPAPIKAFEGRPFRGDDGLDIEPMVIGRGGPLTAPPLLVILPK
jgi:hypothetical protein